MTIQELYAKIGGNYEQAVRVMKMDRLIDKYGRKLPASGTYEALMAAGEAMDATKLFESAHAMKGVCGNLGLDELAAAAGEIAEEFRPGAARRLTDAQVREKIAQVEALYRRVVDGIAEYAGA